MLFLLQITLRDENHYLHYPAEEKEGYGNSQCPRKHATDANASLILKPMFSPLDNTSTFQGQGGERSPLIAQIQLEGQPVVTSF